MGRMDSSMQMVAICQEFGWTYQEYTSQPSFFLSLIREKLSRDNKEHERRVNNTHRGK